MSSNAGRRTSAVPAAATLQWIVCDYRDRFGASREREDAWYRAAQSFPEAVRRAAECQDSKGKRCPHQRRIPQTALRAAAKVLVGAAGVLLACRSFDELHSRVRELAGAIRGIGKLYVYDVATRIGVVLNLRPERVHLHAGTRSGARALGIDLRADSIELSELPEILRELDAWQLEDVLCIYKSELTASVEREPHESPGGCDGERVRGSRSKRTRRRSCST